MRRAIYWLPLVALLAPSQLFAQDSAPLEASAVLLGESDLLSPVSAGLVDAQAETGGLVLDQRVLETHLDSALVLPSSDSPSPAQLVVAVGGPFRLDALPPKQRRKKKGEDAEDPIARFVEQAGESMQRLSDGGLPLLVVGFVPPESSRRKKKASPQERVRQGLSARCAELPNCWIRILDGDAAPSAVVAALDEELSGRLEWSEPAPPDSARWDEDGRLVEPAILAEERLFIRQSVLRGKEVRFWAFVPQREAAGETFPTLYLLHGATGDYRDWRSHARSKLMDLSATYGVVIITPDGDPHGWYVDSPEEETSQLESYFTDELIPYVEGDSGLPVAPGGEHRALAGLSMGGHGALSLALRNPGEFAAATSMSGILDITKHPKSWEIAKRLGPLAKNEEAWQEHSVAFLLRAESEPLLPILIACGDSDKAAWKENLALHEELEAAGRTHEWTATGAGHSWSFWKSELEPHVAFVAEHLRGDGLRPVEEDESGDEDGEETE